MTNLENAYGPEALAVEGYSVCADRSKIDFEYVHRFLSNESYWATHITERRLRRAIDNSMCFSVFHGERQVGFARVVSDLAVFAYLCDVFIDPAHRGRGLGKWLTRAIVAHPDLQHLRRWILGTKDAHGLYTQVGFTALRRPEIFMERFDPETYEREARGNQ